MDKQIEPSNMQLLDEFKKRRHLIKDALEYADNSHTPEDVLSAIEKKRAQLWPLPNSVIVTEIVSYPAGRSIRFWLAAGNMDELLAAEPFIAKWGKENYGRKKVEIIGRKGWIKKLKDYKHKAVLLSKEIKDE